MTRMPIGSGYSSPLQVDDHHHRPAAEGGQGLRLSAGQRGLWYAQRLDESAQSYDIVECVEFNGALDTTLFETALRQAVGEAQSIHATFIDTPEGPRQIVASQRDWHLPFIDLTAKDDPRAAADAWLTAYLRESTHLERGPLFSFALLKVAPTLYFWCLRFNHIVVDGSAVLLFGHRVGDLYSQLATCTPPGTVAFGELTDIIDAELAYERSAEFERDGEYWRARMADMPAPVSLSARRADRAGPLRRSHELSTEMGVALAQLARDQGATLPQLFIGLLAVYLYRMTGQTDLVLGLPLTARVGRAQRGTPAMLSNVVPLRLFVQPGMTLSTLLTQVRREVRQAVVHQRYSGEALRANLGLVGRQQPLWAVAMGILLLDRELRFGGHAVTLRTLAAGPTEDLGINIYQMDTSGRLQIFMDANASLYEAREVDGHLSRLVSLMTRLLERPDRKIGQLDLLSAEERSLLLDEWNETAVAYPSHRCIHELFEDQVKRTPMAVAVMSGEEWLSYAQLNEQANRLARYLVKLGVKPDERVAICAERSLEMVVGLLAILKAGGAYVPLDPSYPPERLAFMLKDSAPTVVLSLGETAARLESGARQVVNLEQAERWAVESATNLSPAGLTSRHLASVIYTSGSTGQPKGATVEHRNLVNHCLWGIDRLALTAEDRLLQSASFSFDASAAELFWALLSGARLILARPQEHQNPAYLSETIERHGITVAQFVPSVLRMFVDHVAAGACQSLRHICCGGEVLPIALKERCLDRLSHCRLHNMYGPTETTVDSTSWVCPAGHDSYQIPIGRPISNARIYLLDPEGLPVALGAVGEIYIGGAGVTRGYLNRAALTAERFLPDCFGTEPGARMYRTGDLGRYRMDGALEAVGRSDFQVKLRGFRIELGEIEAKLAAHSQVREAVVVARESEDGRRLVSYYTGEASAESLRTHLQGLLPEYMVPAAYVKLAALPLTPNGKVNRRALPSPTGDAYAREGYEAPEGLIEEVLAGIWQELLGVERVGRHDNFFALGGDSLQAVRLIERVRQAGLDVDVRALFGQPTLAGLAGAAGGMAQIHVPANQIPTGCAAITPAMLPLIELSQEEIDTVVSAVPGGAKNVQDIYPLAPLQAGVFFHSLSAERGDLYLMQVNLAFDGRERLEQFVSALRRVIERHDILRTSVVWEGMSEPVQVVWREVALSVEEVTLDAAVGNMAGQLQARFDPRHYRLDVRQAPLLAVKVAEDPEHARWMMVLLLHHLVGDAVSMRLLIGEVAAHLRGEEQQLPAPVAFRNYVAHTCLGSNTAADETYFRQMLGSVDEPTLPYGLSEVRGDGSDIRSTAQRVDAALTARVRAVCRRHKLSVASLFHLAWAHVLGRLSDRDDVVFGTVLLGRMQGLSERAMGMFINTLPLRVQLTGCSVLEAARQTQSRLIGLMGHEHATLTLAQRCSSVPAPQPLFSALLNYRHGDSERLLGEGDVALNGIELLGADGQSNYPLAMSVDDLAEEFVLTVQAVAPVDTGRVCGYARQSLRSLVEELEAGGARRALDLEMLLDDERELLLEQWNATQTPYPARRCVHELFEAQAERTPTAVAVMSGKDRLSYAQLNERANRLARHLRRRALRPECMIAISLERSIELVVAELAILKCGAAYVPLDRDAPELRQQFILKDSGCELILTRSDVSIPLAVQAERIDLDRLRLEEGDDDDQMLAAVPGDSMAAAYVMYTSGSTGQPKGVVVSHQGIARLVVNNGYTDFRPEDRVAFAANPAFDATTMEVWGPLLHGSCIVIIDRATVLSPERFRECLIAQQVSVMWIPTAIFHQHAAVLDGMFAQLRCLLVGGEVLDPAIAAKVLRSDRPERLLNSYGPTEVTTFSTTHEIHAAAEGSSIPIGRPISNTRIYVLDRHGVPVPAGVVGEIYIGGPGVARGYLNRPGLTAERFLPDCFGGEPGARLYRTGDLGRYRADGALDYVGRSDFQVKLRGFRIELGEIEAQLAAHSQVRESIVVTRESEDGKRLVAYYAGEASAESLRTHLQGVLPEYMVPAAYVKLATLPLTPNGKVDRRALPAPAGDAYAREGYEAPMGPMEETLACIWRELLGVDRVGRHDNFFSLGGHSLLIIRLLGRLNRENIQATINEIIQSPTIALFVANRGSSHATGQDILPIRTTGSRTPLFLVHEATGVDTYFPVIASAIDDSIPIYGLPALGEERTQPRTFEAMAARCIENLRTVQPRGPYRLAGWSFGGILAYEIAIQLTRQAESVEFVGLLDSGSPAALMKEVGDCLGASARNAVLTKIICATPGSRTDAAASADPLSQPGRPLTESSFEECLATIRNNGLLPESWAELTDERLGKIVDRCLAHVSAALHYVPSSSSLPTYLFVARQSVEASADDCLGWQSIIEPSALRRIDVPGNHHTMLSEHSQVVGQAITRAIGEAERRGRPETQMDEKPRDSVGR